MKRLPRVFRMGTISAVLVSAGCASSPTPPALAAAGLTNEAIELQIAVERGCMPYALGEKTESQAMITDTAMRKRSKLEQSSFPSPGITEPQYTNNMPGYPIVTIYGAGCTVHVRGANAEAFRKILDRTYRKRFGPDYAAHAQAPQPYEVKLGVASFCHDGRIFSSNANPAKGMSSASFDVRIAPAPACAGVA